MTSRMFLRTVLPGMLLLGVVFQIHAASPESEYRQTRIRAGRAGAIVAIKSGSVPAAAQARAAAAQYPHPRPRLAGFTPWVAITTSDEGLPLGSDFEFEHELESSYVGSVLNPYVSPNFVIGLLDSGSDVDLAAGTFADTLGLFGANLTSASIPIGGVGGQVNAYITTPIGFFAAGLSAVNSYGNLDYDALVGHSNVCGLAAPAIDCGNGEVLSAVVGMPFMAFHNAYINVDTPRHVTVSGVSYAGPDVQIEISDPFEPPYPLAHLIPMEFGGLSPLATTANYYIDPLDMETPLLPTLLSLMPGAIPFGGAYFATVNVRQGEPGPDNPVWPARLLVDTGAQSSIMSSAVAAQLSLPFEPDFTVNVCGAGGLVEDVPGYYVDFVKINAWGGALEYSRAPFVLLDLVGPEGTILDGILGMNFFWDRNVIFEPALGGVPFLHVSEPIPFAYGDFDTDLDVDADDTATFGSCFTGTGAQTLLPECTHIDGDEDGDVDLLDFRQFQLCFSSADVTADPYCGF